MPTQTTFIPKQPVSANTAQKKQAAPPPKSTGLMGLLALVAVFFTAGSMGAVYLYQGVLNQLVAGHYEDILAIEDQLNPTVIDQLQDFDRRLQAGDILLRNHVAMSPALRTLESKIIPQLRLDQFSGTISNETNDLEVSTNGQAVSYRAIAQQSMVFSNDATITSHIFSNFNLLDDGTVAFALDITFAPESALFENKLSNLNATAASGSLSSNSLNL